MMHCNSTIRLFLFVIIIPGFTNLTAQPMPPVSDGDNLHFNPFFINPDWDMQCGTEDIITTHFYLSQWENRHIRTDWFNEQNWLGKSANMAIRFSRYALLDVSVDYFSVVFQHEYFGHGARYREFDMDGIFYKFDWPPPYGHGGGQATNQRSVDISRQQVISIWTAGIESEQILNRDLRLHWMNRGNLSTREASLYFWSFQIAAVYVQDSEENLSLLSAENDPQAYIRLINAENGYTDLQNLKMNMKDLKKKMQLNKADPFLFYSMYVLLKDYLWDGKKSVNMPMLHFGNVSYLPAFRAGLTPFGVQYYFENYIRTAKRNSLVELQYGDQTFHKSWGGVGFTVQNVLQLENSTFDITAYLWNQPGLKFGNTSVREEKSGLGSCFTVRGYYALQPGSATWITIELGYKTAGYIDAYPLDASPLVKFGLAFRN